MDLGDIETGCPKPAIHVEVYSQFTPKGFPAEVYS